MERAAVFIDGGYLQKVLKELGEPKIDIKSFPRGPQTGTRYFALTITTACHIRTARQLKSKTGDSPQNKVSWEPCSVWNAMKFVSGA